MSIFEAFIPAAGAIIGAGIGVAGNAMAAKSQKKSLKESNKIQQQALAQATKQYDELRADAAPGVSYLRNLVSVPAGGLYADQVAAQEENRRQGMNDIAHSGLMGSGRAVTASLRSIDSDFVNNALAQNRGARERAASQLTGPYFSAGSDIAQSIMGGGQSQANTAENKGNVTGSTMLANSDLIGKAIGDIGSLAASEAKGRDSRYTNDDIAHALGLDKKETV
jgi:hypothetical protein